METKQKTLALPMVDKGLEGLLGVTVFTLIALPKNGRYTGLAFFALGVLTTAYVYETYK